MLQEIPCSKCGRLNEPQREVCWACFARLRGEKHLAVEVLPPDEQAHESIPEPLRKQLTHDEKLLWHGRPLDKIDFRNFPLLALPLTWVAGAGMIWIGGALLHLFKASWSGGLIGIPFGIVFLLAGIYVLGGPFLQRIMRRGTFYGITDRRVLIVHERPLHRVIARDVCAVSYAQVINETFDGVGDIHLGFNVLTRANSNFEYIDNVQEVAGILWHARKQAEYMPAGTLADDAPPSVARAVVPLFYGVIGFYLLLVLSDTAEIFRTHGKALAYWTRYQDRGDWPPWTLYFIGPVMMYLFYVWAKRYQTRKRAARKIEVTFLAGYAALGLVLFLWSGLSVPKTAIYAVFGVFALILTAGRRLQ